MGIDVDETAWCILETLHEHGPLNANQIQANTKKINRITMYKAFPLLKKDGYIQRDKNKTYSLNTAKYLEGKKPFTYMKCIVMSLKILVKYSIISKNLYILTRAF